jgi:hypothetical protein
MSPVSVISHVIAVALGVWGGWWLIERVSPDLPDPDTDPAVSAPAKLKGGDPDSLFRTGPLGDALEQLEGQMAAGHKIVSLNLTPESLDAETGSGGVALDPGDVRPDAPELVRFEIAEQRSQVSLDDVLYYELRAGAGGPEWYVQLGPRIDPPRTYVAPLDATSAEPGG